MNLIIKRGNLFTEIKRKDPHYQKYVFGHCISADAGMGKGIAVDFVNHFPKIKQLRQMNLEVGQSYFVSPVYNIVTKRKYSEKPTIITMEAALHSLREQMIINNHMYLAIPKIGCGLDRLCWPEVQNLLTMIFFDDEVTIEVYHI